MTNRYPWLKKMYATISKLASADLSLGHYYKVQVMWDIYCSELELTLLNVYIIVNFGAVW